MLKVHRPTDVSVLISFVFLNVSVWLPLVMDY